MGISKLYVRTIVCAVAIVVFGTVQSQAQNLFSMGIKGGLSTSNLFTQGTPTMGLTTGFMAEVRFAKWIAFRTEANLLAYLYHVQGDLQNG